MKPVHAHTHAWPTRDLVSHRVETTPDRTAVIDADTDNQWTYRAFDRDIDTLAAHAKAFTGERIGVLLETGPAFARVLFAAMRTKSTVVPLNVRETPAVLASKVTRAEVETLLYEPETEPLAESVLEASEDTLESESTLETERSTQSIEPASLTPETEFVVLFTSGTTGKPKGVRLTVGNLLSSATASGFRLGVCSDDRWLCCLPTYHMGGLAPILRSTLYGTPVVFQRSFEPDRTGRILAAYDCTGISLVPTMLRRLLDAGWTPPSSLRFVLLGGAPASRSLLERCAQHDVPVCPTYGMSETASQIATARPTEAFEYEGTVGQPLLCTEVSIRDETGDRVEPGDVGHIHVSGPTVTPGYLDEKETAKAFCPHGFRTGDRGRRDADGHLWVLERESDLIVTGGENVDPTEVVETLESHPVVERAAVVGLPDPEWGERVGALVVATRDEDSIDETATANALYEHCRERLAGFKCPKTVGFTETLPRTPSGTIDRTAVRTQLDDHALHIA